MRLVVAGALVDDLAAPRHLLAARRSAPPALAGRWELAGGKVEEGEGPVQALHRELAEELGVRVRLGAEVEHPDGAWPLTPALRMRVWWAVVVAGTPAPLQDHDELRWLERGTWAGLDWLPGDVPLVARLEHLAAGTTSAPRPE
ncbi:(deoxy)nucleoside triphosphate pyrophosphohydrolase [Kineococcus sp. LSe6-4]|uniref:8-oxo-dGTP diphosphatase n=1 Tax=Kineococcus halophytocola TaxID=3234027 RepID=A0ABV4GZB3_9ACTN